MSELASVHIVAYTDWDEFQIRSIWTTARGAEAECKRLTTANDGAGVYAVYEYSLDTAEAEAE